MTMELPESKFNEILVRASKAPMVRIHRDAYLRQSLKRYCSEEQIELAISKSPAEAGVPSEIVKRIANDSITFETSKATGLSAAAGVPGFLWLPATVPADLAQYFGHMLRISQKLAYIYSWPDLFDKDGEDPDDATKSILTLFVGVMLGAQVANSAVSKVSVMMSTQVAKKLPQAALTKGVIYPLVKKTASYLGVRLTTQSFAIGVAKLVPIAGAIVAGGFTLATFLPMSKKLQKHLSGLEITRPSSVRPIDNSVADSH